LTDEAAVALPVFPGLVVEVILWQGFMGLWRSRKI
jgi:hypothetical protein